MIKEYFFPQTDEAAVRLMDRSGTKSIANISLVVTIFESITLSVFMLTRSSIGSEEWMSIGSVLFCILTCLSGYYVSRKLLKEDVLLHSKVARLNAHYYALMSLWAMWSSYRRYENGEQILTFYACELTLVCFIVMKPWLSAVLTFVSYAALYGFCYRADGAVGLNVINYFVLALVSAIGMGMRYHALKHSAEATVRLQKSKDSEVQEKMNILQSIADIYDKVNLIDFVENTEMSVRDKQHVKHRIDKETQTHTIMSREIRKRLMPDQLDRFIEFTDITTVRDRLKGKKILSDDFIDIVDGWFRAQYIPVDADENGVPYKIVFTTRNVEDEKEREEGLIRIAMTDELTRLFNRRSYEEDLAEYEQKGIPDDFVMLSADVNGLKKVNDTKGHAGGDELIKGAAECLLLGIRNRGKVYRTGGDEFAAILRTDDPQTVCRDIEERMTYWRGKYSDTMSISLGFACHAGNEDLSIHELEKKADDEMYHAKAMYYQQKGIDRRASRR